ncbi:MAG: hypothetical protein R3F59_04745 [Myxococcota bacterium]
MIALLLTALTALAARGPQRSFAQHPAGDTVRFDVAWTDASGHPDQLSFSLPAAAVDADKEEITWLPRREINEQGAAAIRAWGRTLPGTKVQATVEKGTVQVRVSGTGDLRAALKQAELVREQATDAWLADHGGTRLEDGSLSFDHAALAADYAPALAPVAAALREGTASDRAFVARALAFVQAIPYEARKRRGGDPGYRRPLALLARNRGDCDSKSVLFLALVRAELPTLPLAALYVPGHMLVGVGLPAEGADKRFTVEGTPLLYAEPVGPALWPLGAKVPRSHRAGHAEARLVPAS